MQAGPIPKLHQAASLLTGQGFPICRQVPGSNGGEECLEEEVFSWVQAMTMKMKYPFGFSTEFQTLLPYLPDLQ